MAKRPRPKPEPTVTLRDHVAALRAADELRLSQLREADQTAISAALISAEKAIATALLAAEKAVLKAEVANDKRFEGVNEFRQTVTDITANNVTRPEFTGAVSNLAEKIAILTDSMNRVQGQSKGSAQGWAYLIAGAGVALGVASLAFAVLGR